MDKLNVTILDDGSVKVETDAVSAANHRNAEQFLLELARACGGKTERRQRQGHTHTQAGITHTH